VKRFRNSWIDFEGDELLGLLTKYGRKGEASRSR
jgi:hypothetical protein